MPRLGRATSLILALSAAAGICLGVGAYTFVYAEGGSYLSNDPRACVNCHVMRDQYQSWQHSSHHAVATCNDCHVPHDNVLAKYLTKADHGWRHSKAFTLQDFHEPIRITPGDLKDVQANCIRCHENLTEQINHATHSGADADCTHCHRGVGHGAAW